MDEERVRVLQMLKEEKITVDEAMKLLEAMELPEELPADAPRGRAKWLRIRVTELGKDKPKVMVNLPAGLVDWALKTGNKFAALGGVDIDGMGVDLNELRVHLLHGIRGKIVDVIDEEERQHVEITIE